MTDKELIGCYKAQVDALTEALDDRIQRIKALEAEVERQYEQAEADILGNMADGGTSCHWCINKHRAAAIREFAERLKERSEWHSCGECSFEYVYFDDIDDLVKEMTEGTDNV